MDQDDAAIQSLWLFLFESKDAFPFLERIAFSSLKAGYEQLMADMDRAADFIFERG